MLKVKPTTKEQLVYYLCQNLSLGTYDKRFLDNIMRLNIAINKPLTTNQASLLDKVVERYRRQLAKQEIDATNMKELPWSNTPIDSLPKYTEAHISIEDGVILIRSPYKKEFVTDFKSLDLPIHWEKETKTWSLLFTEQYLKDVVNCVEKYYDNVNYDTCIKSMFDTLVEYESCKYWEPTLVSRNNNLYVYAITDVINNALCDVELSTTISTLSRLVYMGIKIDESVIKTLPYDSELLSVSVNRSADIQVTNVQHITNLIDMIDPDCVIIGRFITANGNLISQITSHVKSKNIPVIMHKSGDDTSLSEYNSPLLITSAMMRIFSAMVEPKVMKIINLVDARPIKI